MSKAMPKVVMLVANDVSIDGRVQKIALSVSKFADVTVMGITRGPSLITHEEFGFRVMLFPAGSRNTSYLTKVRKYIGKSLIALNRRWTIPFLTRYGQRITTQKIEDSSQVSAPNLPWRQVLLENKTYATLINPVLTKIAPDVLHAHDVHLLSIAGEYAASNLNTHLIYDSHEYIRGLPTHTPEIRKAYAEVENEFIPGASAVITVSSAIAQRLKIDHSLKVLPTVIMNTPTLVSGECEAGTGIREVIGLDVDIPLVVYSGGINLTRGIEIVIDALGYLPDVHFAATSNRFSWYTEQLQERAENVGAKGRLHFVPYVAPEKISQYLSSADLGVSPLPANVVNYDLALPNKLFDYMQAGLPVVVSNCNEQQSLVEELDVGVAYQWNDPEDCARAIASLLASKEVIAKRYEDMSTEITKYLWPAQEEKLTNLYQSLLDFEK